MKVASGSIGVHPVGSPEDYLLTALLDKIMKSLLKLSHSRNYAAVAAWFDAQAISLSLRMHNIDRVTKSGVALNRVLNCEAVCKAFLRLDLATPTERAQSAGAVRGLQVELDEYVLPSLVGLIDWSQRATGYDYMRFFESFVEKRNVESDFRNPKGPNAKLKGCAAKVITAPAAATTTTTAAAATASYELPSSEPPLPDPPSLQQPSIVINMKENWAEFSFQGKIKLL